MRFWEVRLCNPQLPITPFSVRVGVYECVRRSRLGDGVSHYQQDCFHGMTAAATTDATETTSITSSVLCILVLVRSEREREQPHTVRSTFPEILPAHTSASLSRSNVLHSESCAGKESGITTLCLLNTCNKYTDAHLSGRLYIYIILE